jgi:large subunit ribosomal protein L11
MEFCKAFNAQTQSLGDSIVPVVITVYEDRSFTFITKTPPVSQLIKKELKVDKGSATPNKAKIGTLTKAQLRSIAEKKLPDLNTNDVEEAMKSVAGAARSMGADVEG